MTKLHYDLNVPLSSSSSSSKRQREAHSYQRRLHQLGYGEIAFCHTAYGRLNLTKDDANVALPWKDILIANKPSENDNNAPSSSNNNSSATNSSFGRRSSYRDSSSSSLLSGRKMQIYRRLNIVLEEASDVSRLLLNNDVSVSESSSSTSTVRELFQGYDIISLQPMNEPTLKAVCELMLSSSSSSPSTTTSNNNIRCIDIIVLEYATGSRGGYGLPYKLRKEYVRNALSAGITFEVCYGTAILDPKRRQGFLRTLVEFQNSYNGIQKKHLLFKQQQQHSQNNGGIRGNKTRSDKFPLLLSSGVRQNFTLGTDDEGIMAFRSYVDVKCMVCHLGKGDGWWNDNMGEEDVQLLDDDDDDSAAQQKNRKQKRKGRKHHRLNVIMSAAERVLARAGDRTLGVVGIAPQQVNSTNSNRNRCKRLRSHVMATNRTTEDTENEEEEEETFSSLVQWLSKPPRKESRSTTDENSCRNNSTSKSEDEALLAATVDTKNNPLRKDYDGIMLVGAAKESNKDSQENENDNDEVDDDDAKDGFIAFSTFYIHGHK